MNLNLKKLNTIKIFFDILVNLLLSRARMSRRKGQDIRDMDPIHRIVRRMETASVSLTDSLVHPVKKIKN